MNTLQGEKYLWKLPTCNEQALFELVRRYNFSMPIAQTILTRGYVTQQEIDAYLFSSFEKDVAHASLFKDAQKAIDRIITAINNNEKILVFGDYDVDGITSSALMMLCLKPLGANINFFLPHRVRDGYGLSVSIVERAAQNNYKVIITVDNGITAFEPAQKAKELGIDLIITDHHRQHEKVPDAFAIINPNQNDCTYPYKSLAGVGVTFKLLSLLYELLKLEIPSKAFELLLLGTIADVVPLTGENRFWVRHGLQFVNSVESYALKVLKKNGNVTKSTISASDIGYSITPQINALGRLEDPRQGVKFLIGSDTKEVDQVGTVLFELNQARKEIERSIFNEVVHKIEAKQIDITKENIILAASNQWPPGVIGLVASRLVGAYGKPTLLFHLTKDGKAKGSCRSIPEFNMFNALHETRELLLSFGGHSLAAGLALNIDNLPLLKQHLEKVIKMQLTEIDLKQKIMVDAELSLSDVTKKIISDLHHLEPFGNENPQPVFQVKQAVLVQKPSLLKDAHVKCAVFADGIIKPVVFFNRPELFERLRAQEQEPFDLVVHISENHWQGKVSIELIGIDVAGLQDMGNVQ
ncbi:MAG: single-stranded-DNA-specific exonuclease RecJ [Candidatus Babeliales bacterium]